MIYDEHKTGQYLFFQIVKKRLLIETEKFNQRKVLCKVLLWAEAGEFPEIFDEMSLVIETAIVGKIGERAVSFLFC